MTSSKIIATTTSTIEGWTIESYLGVVSCQVVAGTGLFSDFAASFSDVFGGRSRSYQKQLSAIDKEVIESLKEKASMLRANCIIGLRIDHNQISGKDKQMFMVTAYGTAVRASQITFPISQNEKKSDSISAVEINVHLKKMKLIEKCNNIPIELTADEWEFLAEHQVEDIAQNVLESLEYKFKHASQNELKPVTQNEIISTRRYFNALNKDTSIKYLYGGLIKYQSQRQFIIDTIYEGKLFDYNSINDLLSSDNFVIQKLGLIISASDKPYYVFEDIERLKILVDKIKTVFVKRGHVTEEKSMLSSTKKQKWICECGGKNPEDMEYCSSCNEDIYGFKSNELKPINVVKNLQSVIKYLEQIFIR